MTDRNPPTIATDPSDITGENFANEYNSAVGALWDRVPCWLEIDSGTNALVASSVNASEEAPASLVAGQEYKWIATATNTGAMTIAIDGLTAVSLVGRDGSALASGDHVSGQLYKAVYDGTNMRLLGIAGDFLVAKNLALFGLSQSSGTDGGTTTQDAWTAYPLNDEKLNDIAGASLDTATNVGRITLPAGKYLLDARVGFYRSLRAAIRLYNVTAGDWIADSFSFVSGNTSSGPDYGHPQCVAVLDLSAAADIEIRYHLEDDQATNGYGEAMSHPGSEEEEYGFILIQQLAALDEEPIAAVYTVATVPAASSNQGKIIYVSDETGGATLAFSDGSDWRRVQDRAVIST
jgi:hypothetical protein